MTRYQAILVVAVASTLLLAPTTSCQEVDSDSAPQLLINEIEINPPGFDTDREWVELLNPTDEPIDLLGWQISYSYRANGFVQLSEISLVVAPGGRYVFVYHGLRLRNGEGHVFRLLDPEGNVVEETAPFRDEANNDSTWQRFPDGGDPLWPDLWLFQANSRNRSNG